MARLITFRGKTQTLGAWSRETGIPVGTISSRLDKLELTVEEALTRPVDKRFQPIPAQTTRIRPAPALFRDERGRGIVRWMELGQRRKRVFGLWDDPETRKRYAAWVSEWIANQGQPTPAPESLSVAALCVRHTEWAQTFYTKHGKRTSEHHRIRAALATVNELYGDRPASEFGPIQLRAVRQKWVDGGRSISTCNGYLSVVVRCWSWAVGRGLLPASVHAALEHVERLVPGRCQAAVRRPVLSAKAEHLDQILPHLHEDPDRQQVLAAIVQLQRLTGMRPGELLELRPEDVDRSAEPWVYRPPSGGKTLHLEKSRQVFIGARGRELLGPFLDRATPKALVFRVPSLRSEELVPVTLVVYRTALAAACILAKVPVIKPNQIRHTRATELDELGVPASEIAASLGNSAEVVERVYIDSPGTRAAKRVAEEHG